MNGELFSHSAARICRRSLCTAIATAAFTSPLFAAQQPEKKLAWKAVEFAILKFDDKPPKSWNIYHQEKRKGVLLVQLWKRYLLVNLLNQEVFDLDPQKISVKGSQAEWSQADISNQPIEIADWSERDVGPVRRYRFRLGKNGHVLELQMPLKPNGQPMY